MKKTTEQNYRIMQAKRKKLSHFHSALRKTQQKKECPGCFQRFEQQYFPKHQIENFSFEGEWLCMKKAEGETDCSKQCNTGECQPNEPIPNDSDNDHSSAEDMLSSEIQSLLHKKLRKNLHRSDTCNTDYDTESENEEWNSVFEDEIQQDTESFTTSEMKEPYDSNKVGSIFVWICCFICTWQATNLIPDTAIADLSSFLSTLFKVLSLESALMAGLASVFPCSLYMLWKKLGLKKDNFRKYAVCRKCYSIYKIETCTHVMEGTLQSKTCSHIAFPNHTQRARRQPCGELLLKTIKLPSGKQKLYPFKIFCYKSIQETLFRMVQRPSFENACEKWRSRRQQPGYFTDIYDGNIWKEFTGPSKNCYLASERNYCLMLNLDWFQPFEHVQYSIGVLYAVILNLPREMRFKLKNVLLIGIIPDMNHEPSVETFMEPLIQELKFAWNCGFSMTSYNSPKNPQVFKCALICVGCDIPATRKLCGFLGHNAILGCSKCLKEFPGTIGNKQYGGFDVSNWPPRLLTDHKDNLEKLNQAKTQSEKEELQSRYGIKPSKLCDLEYFDPIRMSVIDPMHNLFQGTAKKMMKLWIDQDILDMQSLKKIQESVDSVDVASNVGAIPRKIAVSFGGFTAEQWMNWTNLFSFFALKGILPHPDLEIWRLFALACKVITSKYISAADISNFQRLILKFCIKFEDHYGEKFVTPNMHMHCHIAECLRDYGPVYAFWLFSFERYNGHLGNLPNNNRSIELQMMRRFTRDAFITDFSMPDLYRENFETHLQNLTLNIDIDISTVVSDHVVLKVAYMSSRGAVLQDQEWNDVSAYSFSKQKISFLTSYEYNSLKSVYKILYSDLNSSIDEMPMSCKTCHTVQLGADIFGSCTSRHKRSSLIMAYWHEEGTGQISTDPQTLVLFPGIIQQFVLHTLVTKEESMHHIFAKVLWMKSLPPDLKHYCGKPVECWSNTLFETTGPSSLIPIQRILCKFVKADGHVRGRDVSFICPIGNKIVL